jgi:hypothetical protein
MAFSVAVDVQWFWVVSMVKKKFSAVLDVIKTN